MEFEWSRWSSRLKHGWLLLSLLQAAAFVFLLPPFAKAHWEDLRSHFRSDFEFTTLVTWAMHFAQVVISNLLYLAIYWANIPFFEQYKISPKVWPWRSPDAATRSAFWLAVRTGIRAVVFNNVFIGLPAIALTFYLHQPTGFNASLEQFPDTWTIVWQVAGEGQHLTSVGAAVASRRRSACVRFAA